jgi:predicted nuclease of predicted toxin-antitoxin system
MRILFDENLNWRLRRDLPNHIIATVQSQGWTGIKNGLLLRKAIDSGFEVLLTRDNNLSYQQDLTAFSIAVIVLRLRSNLLQDARLLMPSVQRILPVARRGERTVIGE